MLVRTIINILILFSAASVLTGCSKDVSIEPQGVVVGKYGTYTFGEEEIPVNSYTTSDEDWFLVMLSPLESTASASTYAVVGVLPELIGREVDVERAYQNSDYVFVYEDPTYYHAAFRPLQSGSILIDVQGDEVSIKVDVVTFDGQRFKYERGNIKL